MLKVTSDESMAMARELAKKEGLLVGISAGGAVHVSGLVVVVVLVDVPIDRPALARVKCIVWFVFAGELTRL